MIEYCRDFRRIKRASDFPIHISREICYFMEVQDGKDVGVWLAHPYRDGLSLHADLGPECRGKAAATSARNVLNWLFEHNFSNIYAVIPPDRHSVRTLAQAVGFEFMELDDFGNRIYTIRKLERKVA